MHHSWHLTSMNGILRSSKPKPDSKSLRGIHILWLALSLGTELQIGALMVTDSMLRLSISTDILAKRFMTNMLLSIALSFTET